MVDQDPASRLMGTGMPPMMAREVVQMMGSVSRLHPADPSIMPTSPGETGQIFYDDEYIYLCIADNTWRRALLEMWE